MLIFILLYPSLSRIIYHIFHPQVKQCSHVHIHVIKPFPFQAYILVQKKNIIQAFSSYSKVFPQPSFIVSFQYCNNTFPLKH